MTSTLLEQQTDIRRLDDAGLAAASNMLRKGGLVAFATETVYGLGADATNGQAVARIFEAKGRPSFNPLIIHVPELRAAKKYAIMSPMAEALAERFWPGPLTLILPRRDRSGLSELVSAGLPTLAVRIPAHGGARDLLRLVGRPVAAPSANASGTLSPTEARHVLRSLPGRVDMILDGGPAAIGLESTVIDVAGEQPILLRPGGVSKEALEESLGRSVSLASADDVRPKSPGMLLKHYAPSLPVRLNAEAAEEGEAFLGFGNASHALSLSPSGDLREAAANLFATLHALDDPSKYCGIAVSPIPETGLGLAINDRLLRAARR